MELLIWGPWKVTCVMHILRTRLTLDDLPSSLARHVLSQPYLICQAPLSWSQFYLSLWLSWPPPHLQRLYNWDLPLSCMQIFKDLASPHQINFSLTGCLQQGLVSYLVKSILASIPHDFFPLTFYFQIDQICLKQYHDCHLKLHSTCFPIGHLPLPGKLGVCLSSSLVT